MNEPINHASSVNHRRYWEYKQHYNRCSTANENCTTGETRRARSCPYHVQWCRRGNRSSWWGLEKERNTDGLTLNKLPIIYNTNRYCTNTQLIWHHTMPNCETKNRTFHKIRSRIWKKWGGFTFQLLRANMAFIHKLLLVTLVWWRKKCLAQQNLQAISAQFPAEGIDYVFGSLWGFIFDMFVLDSSNITFASNMVVWKTIQHWLRIL